MKSYCVTIKLIECYLEVLSYRVYGAVYYTVQGDTNFCIRSYHVAIQSEALKQFFPVVLFLYHFFNNNVELTLSFDLWIWPLLATTILIFLNIIFISDFIFCRKYNSM